MPVGPDQRTLADLARRRKARSVARRAVRLAEEEMKASVVAAYRGELGMTIRSASPVLVALLEHAGSSLDAVAWQLRPPKLWPARPRVPSSLVPAMHDHALRYYAVARRAELEELENWLPPLPEEVEMRLPCGGHVRAVVAGHALEARGRVGEVLFSTSDGILRLRLGGELPTSVVQALPGLAFHDLVQHLALDGHGWTFVRLDPSAAGALEVHGRAVLPHAVGAIDLAEASRFDRVGAERELTI